jgi:hypothetical protein
LAQASAENRADRCLISQAATAGRAAGAVDHPNPASKLPLLEVTTLTGIYIKIQPVSSFTPSMVAVREQQRKSIYHFTSTPIVA